MSECSPGTCPMDTILSSAEALSAKYGDQLKEQRDRIAGGIALTRLCFDQVRNAMECEGAGVNQNGHLICPLQDATYGTRAIAFGVPNQAAYAVNLDHFAGGSNEQGTGQYL